MSQHPPSALLAPSRPAQLGDAIFYRMYLDTASRRNPYFCMFPEGVERLLLDLTDQIALLACWVC